MVACETVCLRRPGGSRGGELQAGRFFANPKAAAAKTVEGWGDLTGAAVAGRHILAIQGSTEVKFPAAAQRRRGPGPVKKGNTYGILAHRLSPAGPGHGRPPAGWRGALFKAAGGFAVAGTRELERPARQPDRAARTATVEMWFGEVEICRPRDEQDRGLAKTVRLRLAEVREAAPPEGVEPIIDAARTVKNHRNGILRWLHSQIANGLLEGINSLVQAAKAKARGYRSTRNLKAMVYLIAGKLDLGLPA